jgi:multidrug resistance efflux pump
LVLQAALGQAEGQLAQSQGQLEQARAQLAQAEAQVAVAEANQHRIQLDVDRYTPLAEAQAITQQDLDNATQNNMAAKAQVQASRAQVQTSRAQNHGRNCPLWSPPKLQPKQHGSIWDSPGSRRRLTVFPE